MILNLSVYIANQLVLQNVSLRLAQDTAPLRDGSAVATVCAVELPSNVSTVTSKHRNHGTAPGGR